MIQDMLQIYRLDDANTKMDISEFNLSDTVQFFIKDFDNVFKSNNLNLELNIGESIFVEADFKLIKRVISNFITNAIKYTPNNEKISVTLKENDDFVCFELINYGININEIDLQNIWMPFYRVEHTEKRVLGSKGSGIGLYLVSEILKAHEAEYGIENFKNGVKAHFTIKKRVDL
jgi:two-component system sensor histidine kinase VanS